MFILAREWECGMTLYGSLPVECVGFTRAVFLADAAQGASAVVRGIARATT